MPRRGAWGLLLESARRFARPLAIVVVFAIIGTAASLTQPIVYGAVVNDLSGLYVLKAQTHTGHQDEAIDTSRPHGRGHIEPRTELQAGRTLLIAVLALFVINLVSRFFALAADNIAARTSADLEQGLMLRTLRHVLRLPLSFFARRSSGAIAKQIDLVDQVSPVIGTLSKEVLPEAICVVGALAIMLTQHVSLTVVALATLPAYLLISRALARRLQSGIDDYYERWEDLNASIQEPLGAIKTVKLAGAEQVHARRFGRVALAAYADHLRRNRVQNGYMFWQICCVHLGQALVLAYGGWKVIQHQLTPGDVVMFVAYLDLIYGPIDRLTGALTALQDHFARIGRTAHLLEAGEEEGEGGPLPDGVPRIEFRDVVFGYDAALPVLKGLSFVADSGKATALVGPSGAGKTTAVDLLLRLYEPQGGEIVINGAPLGTLDPAALRREVAVVAADGALFAGTLADNIRYCRPEADDADVWAAANAAGLGPAIQRLPEGLATVIGERGAGLSVGERQRLQIARVLASKARILIMDEATANLDYATEQGVKAAIDALRQGRTTLVIAHRYSMVQDADHVVVLEAGQVAAEGTPAHLAQQPGWFAGFARAHADRTE